MPTCGRAGCQVSTDSHARGTLVCFFDWPLTGYEYELPFQSASADWIADILRHTYDDALCMKGIKGGVDGVFICAGMLRGDSVYGPGMINR